VPLVEISDFVGGVLGRGIKHGDRNHGGQAASHSTGEEEVESHLIAAAVIQI
jgi:hypothetical protein